MLIIKCYTSNIVTTMKINTEALIFRSIQNHIDSKNFSGKFLPSTLLKYKILTIRKFIYK